MLRCWSLGWRRGGRRTPRRPPALMGWLRAAPGARQRMWLELEARPYLTAYCRPVDVRVRDYCGQAQLRWARPL